MYKAPDLKELRDRCVAGLKSLREDYKRKVNPTPYKVSVSKQLREEIEQLWMSEVPVAELS